MASKVRISRHRFRPVLLVALVFAVGSCAPTLRRNPPPKTLHAMAELPGFARVRYWGDAVPEQSKALIARYIDRFRSRHANRIRAGGPVFENLLALSGGGDDGAFGAGLLVGWTKHGSRPRFDVVTGISTGALVAPFAFLGPKWDDKLSSVYTEILRSDVLSLRLVGVLFGASAIATNAPLRRTIARFATTEMLAAIAAEHRKGRRLLIGTTNLDAGRLVIWDIGAIASSGNPRALDLFRKILLASAAVPGALPPVLFQVRAGGRNYAEMHVDGGVTAQVFAYPVPLRRTGGAYARLGVPVRRRLWVVRNGKLGARYAPSRTSFLGITKRAISVLIKKQGIGDLFQLYTVARRDGIAFRLASVPDCFDRESERPFEPAYMRALFGLGVRLGENGYPWLRAPPGLQAPQSTDVVAVRYRNQCFRGFRTAVSQ